MQAERRILHWGIAIWAIFLLVLVVLLAIRAMQGP
jgi:hypothetical protein